MSSQECIAKRVRQAMDRRRISARRLAELIDAPYGTLRNYLKGSRPTPAPIMARICDALGVSADWLLFARPATIDLDCLADAAEELESDNVERPIGDWKRPYASRLAAHYFIQYRARHGSDAESAASEPATARRQRAR